MSLFSQRKGLKPVKSVIQVDSMDSELRNGLWDIFHLYGWPESHEIYRITVSPEAYNLSISLWHGHLKEPIDTMYRRSKSEVLSILRKRFFDGEWYDVYDFIEFVASNYPGSDSMVQSFMEACNSVMERELSAYRFVGGKITEITSEEEVNEIEEALGSTSSLRPVAAHMKRALDLLADRNSPDYRNSIKESMSAVEAMCNLVAGSSSATLGQALSELDKNKTVDMHPALRGAFQKLYGYTSDADSIRHALLEESNLDFEDAKFMLVSCSAFVNYLKAKAAKAELSL